MFLPLDGSGNLVTLQFKGVWSDGNVVKVLELYLTVLSYQTSLYNKVITSPAQSGGHIMRGFGWTFLIFPGSG